MTTFRCGDTVLHIPSGETWLVAYDDPETGYLSPAGWPPGEVKSSTCILVEACTDKQHRQAVQSWRDSGPDEWGDYRKSRVLRLYTVAPLYDTDI